MEKQERKENKKDDDVESGGNDVDDDSDDANDDDNDDDDDVESHLRSRGNNFHRRLRFKIILTVGMIIVPYIRFFNIQRRSEFYWITNLLCVCEFEPTRPHATIARY